MTVSVEIIVIGMITGLCYAVLAAGLVLVHRATKVINFAHGEIGAFGAMLLAELVVDEHWNFFAAFAVVLVVGAAIGALIELTVIRRLFHASRVVVLVATIGLAEVLFFAQAALTHIHTVGARYPTPIHHSVRVGDVLLRGEHLAVIVAVPLVILALSWFLNRTTYGVAVRAVADDAERAQLAGISVRRVSTLVWVLAAVLSTATAVLINPVRGVVLGNLSVAIGPGLLLRALVAALIGRFRSLPMTLLGGVVTGVVEALLFVNISRPGFVDFVLFLVVLVLVFTRGRDVVTDDGGSWSLAPKPRPLPERVRSLPWARRLPTAAALLGFAVAAVLPLFITRASQLFLVSRVSLFAIVALSVTVLTGWAGQLSLGQFAFVGIGSMVTASLHQRGMPFAAAVGFATVAGIVAALAVGLPALRIRGLFLSVTTLAFAIAAHGYLLSQHPLTDTNLVYLPRGRWWLIDLRSHRVYYYLCLLALVAAAVVVGRFRRGGLGRAVIAVRDNETAAAAFTVSPARAKLAAFAVSGALAALAGALFAGLRVQFGADSFGPEESLRVVAMAIIGGLGSVPGAILGAVYVIGLPALIGDSLEVRLLTSGVGLLLLVLYLPGGLLDIVYRVRDRLLGAWISRFPAAPPEVAGVAPAAVDVRRDRPVVRLDSAAEAPSLRARAVSVRFGGLEALTDVSIDVEPGEVVGLIGTNGAGKSTLMNVLSGFLVPQRGTVELADRDITGWSPPARARAGLGRVFQDARLFGDLTVTQCISVALEAREESELVPSVLGLAPALDAERRKGAEAAELIDLLGLGAYAHALAADLSTGTRRVAELACLFALQSRVLLLDEPTAGLAQREAEAFAPLISQVQRELCASALIIEHDMPLIMSLSDRVYCLEAGRVIAHGQPDEIRADAIVIASYLGTDQRAIQRSGSLAVG
ncbi:MAG: inner-rane translocator [Acidimicrobiales bacterium]|jgi:ABC-type branched-subunit amino acid transport system ATPase component/ABC-type branched-subunit amino acid transport system permease subunit|nr:inner-rane translocator [Acidimicrobiales bacterium]